MLLQSHALILLLKNVLYICNQEPPLIVPLELEGAELPLYKVAVKHLLTPRGPFMVAYAMFVQLNGISAS